MTLKQPTRRQPRRPPPLREPPTAVHDLRLVLGRFGEDWGEAEFAIKIAPFARDVGAHLRDLELPDLYALRALGRAADRHIKQRARVANALAKKRK